MTLLELKEYFENYATRHIDLRHDRDDDQKKTFYCLNTEDSASEYIRNAPLDLIMILFPPDKSQTPPAGENYNWNKNTCFMILKRCELSDNDGVIAAQSHCEEIAGDFCTRMIADQHLLLSSLESGSISMGPVGPIVENHYGYMCMFNIIDTFNQYVDPSRWIA